LRIGVDIGGTKTDAVAIAGTGAMVQQLRLSTGYGPDAVLSTAVEAVTRVAELAGIRVDQAASIGVGVPGRVDARLGTVAHAVNLGVDGLDLGTELSARLGAAVRIENDVNAAALGAYHLLEGEGWPTSDWPGDHGHSMAYLNLGTGLAAGLVLGGRLWRGSRGTAGEIGHIPVDPAGPLCPCGQRGCLELMASGSAIARQWTTDHPRPAQHLFDAADAGDPLAIDVRARLLESVASAVRVLVLTVDVDFVVIGGGIASLGAALLDGVRAVLARRATESPFLASLELAERVRVVPAGFPSAAVGAAFAGATAVAAGSAA
jgi:predicted NBD/HSP70 family sugar kinase